MNSSEKNEMPKKKFNVVDAAIIVIIVLLIAGAAWKLFSASQAANEEASQAEQIEAFEELQRIRYTVECHNVPISVAEDLENTEQLQLMSGNQLLAGFITGSERQPITLMSTEADGSELIVENQNLCKMIFTIEAVYDPEVLKENKAYTVANQELRLGKSYIVKTESIEVTGYITSMEVVDE